MNTALCIDFVDGHLPSDLKSFTVFGIRSGKRRQYADLNGIAVGRPQRPYSDGT